MRNNFIFQMVLILALTMSANLAWAWEVDTEQSVLDVRTTTLEHSDGWSNQNYGPGPETNHSIYKKNLTAGVDWAGKTVTLASGFKYRFTMYLKKGKSSASITAYLRDGEANVSPEIDIPYGGSTASGDDFKFTSNEISGDNAEHTLTVFVTAIGSYDEKFRVAHFLVEREVEAAIEPTINLSETELVDFTYLVGNGPSAEQSFTVGGTLLTEDISITAPADYEISLTTGDDFAAQSPIVLTQVAGDVVETTVYTRLKAGLSTGDYNDEVINLTSTGAEAKTVTCSGSVDLNMENIFEITSYDALPEGWEGTAEVGSYFKLAPGYLITGTLDLSGYSDLQLSCEVATWGGGTSHAMNILVSSDNGITWTAHSFESNIPPSSSYVDGGTFDLSNVSSTTKIKFDCQFNNKGIRLQNILLKGVAIAVELPVVTADAQSLSNSTASAVFVQSNKLGAVYVVLDGEPQSTVADFEAAIAAGKAATTPITEVDTDVMVVVAGLAVGTYYPYAVDTEGNISLKGTNAITVVAGGSGIESVLPEVTELFQNYPNPFNPETEINFNIAKDSNVNISVFNYKGELVQELVNKFQPAGRYSVKWNGSNATSGIYFYKMSAGNYTKIMRAVMVK